MKKLKLVAVVILLVATALLAWAHPFSITCPVDGHSMSFDHQVGYGDKAVCWYSHDNNDYTGHPERSGHHEAYVNCND
jgi:hypothetical protein